MGLELALSAAGVCLYDFWAIEGDALEGVDRNEDDARVGVDGVLRIAVADSVEYWG